MIIDSPSVAGLRRHAATRSEQARRRITKALNELVRSGGAVNINAVARRAGVSRKTIYQHSDLREKIQRAATGPSLSQVQPVTALSPESTIVAALRRQLREQQTRHRSEVSALKALLKERDEALAVAHGEIHRLGRLAGS